MKAKAFSPGHISGFFEPVINSQDLEKVGSRGAGINVSLGAISEVNISDSDNQYFEFIINGEKIESPVLLLALKYLIGEKKLDVTVNAIVELPLSQGFGMSAAIALSASLAVSKILKISKIEAMKGSHFSEIQNKTGLGDVVSSFFGGIEIRKHPGLPPWGMIEHIPGDYEIVLCIIGENIRTESVLSDPLKLKTTADIGNYCTNRLLEKPSIENLFRLSQEFAKKTGLANKEILKAIRDANRYGMASMCMLGNSIFAIGKTDKICDVLKNHGKVYVCSVDNCGARVLNI